MLSRTIHERKAICAAQRQEEHQSEFKSHIEGVEYSESRPLHWLSTQRSIQTGLSDDRCGHCNITSYSLD